MFPHQSSITQEVLLNVNKLINIFSLLIVIGVLKAVENVNSVIGPALISKVNKI